MINYSSCADFEWKQSLYLTPVEEMDIPGASFASYGARQPLAACSVYCSVGN